ncbi:MAG: DUF3536 domain-containing protein [Candidatus Omnitrophica bacterium]|nr:DUF3536 domain-containing protein [Candidatus Omnitrophota bacterium]
MTKELCLAIHGHFYQPPRENPWIEQIELQKSAAPAHDWNERVFQECYFPNSVARVLDERNYIVDIVNNFEGINFNIGPTLMSWLKEKHPGTYHRIIDADKRSLLIHHGHGNAIAQVYNHMIMPLANRKDKVTQIKWGLEDFRHRFGREPESIWLPETACDEETLEVLVDHGIKYIVLEPGQAGAVRNFKEEKWHDVSNGKIDPKKPYRCFLKNRPERYIDIFFYDGPISRAAAFGDLLFDAKHFMNRIEGAKSESEPVQLIHIATDGESFGHHKVFGDRALAYLISVEAPKRGFKTVNYGEFLENHPPQYVVRPYFGEDGAGTSWSCSHGIKRWEDHCGCRGVGPAEWTQHWRKPLREALNWLRDELSNIFEQEGSQYLKDVWHARDEYIQVILDRSEENVARFFGKHAKKELVKLDITRVLKLFEMERHAMLMYTSCGWFFTDLSGIETIQIIQYAARAIELAEDITNRPLEEKFLERLELTKSNVTQLKDGRVIYEKFIRPSKASFPHVVSFYGIDSIFKEYIDKQNIDLYCFKLQILHQHKEVYGDITLNLGIVKIQSTITLEEQELVFTVLQFGAYDFRSSIKPLQETPDFENVERDLFDEFHSSHIIELIKKIDKHFGEKHFSLKDIPLEWRIKIISMLTKESIAKINEAYDRLYEDNRRMNEIYRSINLPIPDEIRYAVEYTLGRRIIEAIEELAQFRFDIRKAPRLYKLTEIALELNIETRKSEVSSLLSGALTERVKALAENVSPELATECINIIRIAKKINIPINERTAQDYLFSLFKKWQENSSLMSSYSIETVKAIFKLGAAIWLHPKELKKEFARLFSEEVAPPDPSI